VLQVLPSAYKHGLDREDIEHGWRNAIRIVQLEYAGDTQLMIIGPSRSGALLELIAVPAHAPERIIHADRLRPKYYDWL
jgi:hypothetical protein